MKLPMFICAFLGHSKWIPKTSHRMIILVCSRCDCVHPSSIRKGVDLAVRGKLNE